MCENQYNNHFCPNHFYYQYMQQHAAMMHWIQNLHSNVYVPDAPVMAHSSHQSTPHPKAVHYAPEYRVPYSSYETSTTSTKQYSSSFSENHPDTQEPEYFEENSEEDDSDCEYELNVEAILAMRKAKEDMKKDELESSTTSSSIAMLDHVHEEFEIVELGSLQERQAKRSIMVGNNQDKHAEMQCEKEVIKDLYGEDFIAVSGMEAALAITYESLCDKNQPPVWPVYPLRLKSCIQ